MLVREKMKAAVFLNPGETVAAAARRLRKDNIGCLPVCQDGRLLGMITDRDIAMRSVREAMSVDAICCTKDDSIEKAATIMREAHVQRLAVINDDRQLVGVISMTDLEGGSSERRPFEVIFYKEILDHAGLPHHSQVMRVSVAQGTKQEAVGAAISQFEETKRVTNWNTVADGYDVLSIHIGETGESIEVLELTSERDAEIRPRAHALWEQAGLPEGQDARFWEQAALDVDSESRSPK
jgi:predicted transcriptional regulator